MGKVAANNTWYVCLLCGKTFVSVSDKVIDRENEYRMNAFDEDFPSLQIHCVSCGSTSVKKIQGRKRIEIIKNLSQAEMLYFLKCENLLDENKK